MQRYLASTLDDDKNASIPSTLFHAAVVEERATNNQLPIRRPLFWGGLRSMALGDVIAHEVAIGVASGSGDGPVFSNDTIAVLGFRAGVIEKVCKFSRVAINVVRISRCPLATELCGVLRKGSRFLVTPATG